jgi:hypothetical protein
MNVSENIIINDRVTEQLTYGSATTSASSNPSPLPNYTFQNGTSTGGTVAGLIDLWWEKANATVYTLAASATMTITWSALTDDEGRTVAYHRLRKLHVMVTSKNFASNDHLTFAPGATHGLAALKSFDVWDSHHAVFNGPAGLPIVASTTDQTDITNNGASSMTFAVFSSGCST